MTWAEMSLPWQAALEMAWQAYGDGCMPIGSVTTDADGKLLSRGRNRIYANLSADGRRRGNTLAHAEVDALGAVDYDAIDPHVCTIYTTMEPCPMCLGTIYMSGFRSICFASHDPYAGSTNLLGTTRYLSQKPIRVEAPFDACLEIVLTGLYFEHELATGGGHIRTTDRYPCWQQSEPRGVALGEELYSNGEARRRQGLPAQAAFDWLLGYCKARVA